MNKIHRALQRFFYILIFILFFSCDDLRKSQSSEITTSKVSLKYAKGFAITNFKGYTELIISKPWPNAAKSYKYLLLKKDQLVDHDPSLYDGVINIPVKNTIVTSTTHLPAIELLDVGPSLIGFPGTDYVSSAYIRDRIDRGLIKELGQNEQLNTEVILSLNPDVVIGFGIDGVNKAFQVLNNGGIPVIYNGDWAEDSPLAKAEWIKLFGALYDEQEKAMNIFQNIETSYLSAREIAKKATDRPTVLSGAMHKEVWYLPYGNSPEGQFLEDANVNYLWKESQGSGSLALSFETVFVKAKDADIWINPSVYSSYEQLKSNNILYSRFEAFKTRSIYSMSLTKGATGGILYYELGTARPDLVLKDLIKICYPELLPDYESTFFKPLLNGKE